MPTLDCNGAALHYRDEGSGRPLLLLHGVWMNSTFFDAQIRHFSTTHRVIAPDFRGHGASPATPAGHTVAQYARDVHALIGRLGLVDTTIIGWSMGALVAWSHLRQHGTTGIHSLVVIDQSASDFRWDDWPLGFLDTTALIHFMQQVQEDRDTLVRDTLVPLMLAEPPTDEQSTWLHHQITLPDPGTASAIFFDQSVQDFRPDLPAVDVPTLLCFGADEKLIPVAAGEHLRDHMPHAELAVLDGCGHMPFLERPDLFNTTLDRFLAQQERT